MKDERMEEQLSKQLEEGDMIGVEPGRGAVERLSPRTEIRIRSERDPIVEETKLYRRMAEEADDRYDDYMKRTVSPESGAE